MVAGGLTFFSGGNSVFLGEARYILQLAFSHNLQVNLTYRSSTDR